MLPIPIGKIQQKAHFSAINVTFLRKICKNRQEMRDSRRITMDVAIAFVWESTFDAMMNR